MMSVPQQTLDAVTATTEGTAVDLGEIKEWHEAYVVLSGYTGGTIQVVLGLSADGVNWWNPDQALNWAFDSDGTFHISTSASTPGPINALARYVNVSATFDGGAVGTVSAWTLSK